MTSTSFRDWVDPFRLYNPRVPAGRLMYVWGGWLYPLIWFVIVLFAAGIVEAGLGYYDETPVLDCVSVPIYIAYIVAEILITLRRLRDLGMSGWTILVALIPLVNFVFGLYLLLAAGKRTAYFPVQAEPAYVSPPAQPAPFIADPVTPPSPPLRASSAAPKTSLDQATVCAHCGGQLAAGARYCAVCGAPREV